MKLAESKDAKEKQKNMEKYKKARKEDKLVVTMTKNATFERLHITL